MVTKIEFQIAFLCRDFPLANISTLFCSVSRKRLICMDYKQWLPVLWTSGWVWSVVAWKEKRGLRSEYFGYSFLCRENPLLTECLWVYCDPSAKIIVPLKVAFSVCLSSGSGNGFFDSSHLGVTIILLLLITGHCTIPSGSPGPQSLYK